MAAKRAASGGLHLRARLLDSQEREGRRHQGAGLDPFAAGPFLLRRHERRGEGLTRDDDDGRNGSLTTGVCLASDPAGTAMELVDRSEPLVLLDDPVDLRVLMIERDREPEGFDPDRLVLQAREPDGLGATTVGALAQVGIDPVARPRTASVPSSVHSFISRKTVSLIASLSLQSDMCLGARFLIRRPRSVSREEADQLRCYRRLEEELRSCYLEQPLRARARAHQ